MNKCKCSYTLNDLVEETNKVRVKNGFSPMPRETVIRHWHKIKDNYEGNRNPYSARGKIGLNYVFNHLTCERLAKKIATIPYKKYGSYQEWRNAA